MLTPHVLAPHVGGDLLEWCRIVRIDDETAEVRGPLRSVLDIAKGRVKRAGFHVYGVPDAGTVHRFRVRQRAHK